jgi:hypothetical protein
VNKEKEDSPPVVAAISSSSGANPWDPDPALGLDVAFETDPECKSASYPPKPTVEDVSKDLETAADAGHLGENVSFSSICILSSSSVNKRKLEEIEGIDISVSSSFKRIKIDEVIPKNGRGTRIYLDGYLHLNS